MHSKIISIALYQRFALAFALSFSALAASQTHSEQNKESSKAEPVAMSQAATSNGTVRLSIIKTATSTTREAMLFAGGQFGKTLEVNFSAVLVEHGSDRFLFDTGLGDQIDSQYVQDMAFWRRPFFKYNDPVVSARRQIESAGLAPIESIILSHAHWDHASGLSDFPGAQIWLSTPEFEHVQQASQGIGSAWPSQVSAPNLRWRQINFDAKEYEGFDQSVDLYNDDSVVLVSMFGHTQGSIGMFVRTSSGKRFFFVGDIVWSAAALQSEAPKMWLARMVVDQDSELTQQAIRKIRQAQARDNALIVVPAHDSVVQRELGYFPLWVY